LLLDTDPHIAFAEILQRFHKSVGSSAPDLAHQLNCQSASQNAGESLRQWADRMLTLATQAFLAAPDVSTHAIPRLCHGAEDHYAGIYALDSQPWTVEQVVDRMQYFQHSRQTKSSKPRREVRKVGPDGGHSDKEWKELKK
jgi:hypothetical protein